MVQFSVNPYFHFSNVRVIGLCQSEHLGTDVACRYTIDIIGSNTSCAANVAPDNKSVTIEIKFKCICRGSSLCVLYKVDRCFRNFVLKEVHSPFDWNFYFLTRYFSTCFDYELFSLIETHLVCFCQRHIRSFKCKVFYFFQRV